MSAKRSRKSWQPANKRSMALLEGAIAVMGLVVASTMGAFADDVLPEAPQGLPFSWWRMGFLVFTSLVLIGLLWGRLPLRRVVGTLFHVQVLDEGMADWRKLPVEQAKNRQIDAQSLTRWPNLAERTVNGVIDVHQDTHEVGVALEELINTNQQDGPCVVAPNMLWPIALAVGGYLPARENLRLLELTDATTKQQGFVLEPRDWGDAVECVTVRTKKHPDGSPVAVLVEFTRPLGDSLFSEHGVTEVYRIQPKCAEERGVQHSEEQLSKFAAGIAEELVQLKKATGGRELIVAATITKTQALALGWHLAQRECAFFPGTHLMHFAGGATYIPMRVRSSQPAHLPWPRDSIEDC